jgi:primary-amine oxidase
MTARRFRPVLVAALALGCIAPGRALVEEPPPAPGAGHAVEWAGWKFRWGTRYRDGLFLRDVSFRGRAVLKYAGMPEIFVPYDPGQPRPEDAVDGMGKNLAELLPGQDCRPGTVCRMFNAEGAESGKRVVAMHEESAGLVYLGDAGRAYGKMLVLWCASRLGDYTYIIQWRFRDDGCLMPQVGLTGRLSHTRKGSPSPDGAIISRNEQGETVFAPSHVHNFYFRLDFDIDGPENDVVEEFRHQQDEPRRSLSSRDGWTPIPREAARSLDGETFRSWRVADRLSTNVLGHRRSYELVPGGNGIFRGAESELAAQADLWVTRFKPREFPYSSTDPRPLKQALPTYANDESLEGQDVVLWYAMHVHHIPRTEDWPAMPVEWAGFQIVPRDFLDSSPLKTQ